MKLTKPQQRVVDRMREGWPLGRSSGRWWLQRDGVGCGGPTEEVNANTAHALYVRGVIRKSRDYYPLQEWRLSPKWKERNGIPRV